MSSLPLKALLMSVLPPPGIRASEPPVLAPSPLGAPDPRARGPPASHRRLMQTCRPPLCHSDRSVLWGRYPPVRPSCATPRELTHVRHHPANSRGRPAPPPNRHSHGDPERAGRAAAGKAVPGEELQGVRNSQLTATQPEGAGGSEGAAGAALPSVALQAPGHAATPGPGPRRPAQAADQVSGLQLLFQTVKQTMEIRSTENV